MSLTSLLLAKSRDAPSHRQNEDFDENLDDLFRAKPERQFNVDQSDLPGLVRKLKRKQWEIPPGDQIPENTGTSRTSKRRKADAVHEGSSFSDGGNEVNEEDNGTRNGLLTQLVARVGKVRKTQSALVSSLEYSGSDDGPFQSEMQDRIPPQGRHSHRKKAKFSLPEETPEQRDLRTIFVGNILVDVAKSKSLQKQLIKHILSRVPGAKIDSMRFRSVAFGNFMAKLQAADTKPPDNDPSQTKQERHGNSLAKEHDDGAVSESQQMSGGRAKPLRNLHKGKRVAFIKGNFHKEVDTVNAYIVFAYTPPSTTAEGLSPTEAARLAVSECDNSTFLGRTLRVDRVGQHMPESDGNNSYDALGDSHATLFIGNLDFSAREEDLRAWFESLVTQLRGPRSATDANEAERKWVQRVRIIRDRDTQLGKGFAYVRFADRECVEELLALEQSTFRFAKRQLRVQRCVGVSLSRPSAKHTKPTRGPSAQKLSRGKAVTPVPSGDRFLGEKLASLSKEERKIAKASNLARVQRRLAKKKAAVDAKKLDNHRTKVRNRKRERDTSKKRDNGFPGSKRERRDKSKKKKSTRS